MLKLRPGIALLAATLASTGPVLLAQTITFSGNIALPDGHPFILPNTGSQPNDPGSHFLVTLGPLYRFDYSTSSYQEYVSEVAGAKLLRTSLVAQSGASPTTLNFVGQFFTYYTFNLGTGEFTELGLDIAYPTGNNSLLMQNPSSGTVVANNKVYSLNQVDPLNQHGTLLLGTTNGTSAGQLSTVGSAAFGPDGLLYIHDLANGVQRIQSFDLSAATEAARFRGSFDLVAGATSFGAGMAISPSGHIYLGDGLGGGVEYDLDGSFLGAFGFTGSASPDLNGLAGATGKPFVNLDLYGNIFVYTPGTGMHEYYDSGALAAIPEPSTYALLGGLAALGATCWHRRRRSAPSSSC